MPSGAKKRKAAKRKTEQEQQLLPGVRPPGSPTSNETSSPHSLQGNGVSEEQDPMSKGSMGTESGSDVASPMAQDSRQCHVAVEDNDEQVEARSEATSEKGKKESDSAGLVDVVKLTEDTQTGDKERLGEPFPLQTEVDTKDTEMVHSTVIEVKKDEILPLLLNPVPPTSVEAPVSKMETFTIECIQFEKGEDVCVPGEQSQLAEHKHLEVVDIANLDGRPAPISSGFVDVVKLTENTQTSDKAQLGKPFPLQTEEDAKETEMVHSTVVEVKKDEILPLLLNPVPPRSVEAPVSETKTFTIECIQFEKGDDVCVQGEKSQVVEHKHLEVDIANLDERPVRISEGQARDSPVESLKVVESATDAPTHKIEERVLHLSDATTEDTNHLVDCRHDSDDCEMAGTTEVFQPTKLEKRTSWLSCCGLFDVFFGVKS